MSHRCIVGTVVVAAAIAFTSAACSKDENRAPELATRTPEQSLDQPKTIDGCLRPSAAPNTFVLTASEVAGATTTATYQLIPKPGLDLQAYAGQDVHVSGTLRSSQTVATSGEVETAKPAKGAAGSPTVETKTEVEVRKFDVDSVQPTGQRCVD